jgi:hypothetical protein
LSSRVQYRKDYLNPSGEVVFSQANAEHTVITEPGYAIVVTTQYHTKQAKDAYRPQDEKGLPPPVVSTGSTLIEIKSRAVIHALRTVVGYYPGARFTGDTVSISEPFPLLYHYREELQAYRDDFADHADQDQDCREDPNVAADIKILLDLFEEMCGQNVRDELSRYALAKPTCTHDMLWMLYKPGTDVYWDLEENKVYNAYVLRTVEFTYTDKRASTYELGSWNMAEDNMYVGASQPRESLVSPFAGEKEIGDLRIFPCRFMTKDKHGTTHDERRAHLVNRGEMYYNLLKGPQFASFDGFDCFWPATAYRGRVMVDMHQYTLKEDVESLADDVEMSNVIAPRCTCTQCEAASKKWSKSRIQFAGYSKINPYKTAALTEHQRFINPRAVYAFVLKYRSWSMCAPITYRSRQNRKT